MAEASSTGVVQQTFVFADLAGYSALTEAHGDEHAADVAAEFCRSARAILDGYTAEEVKAIGDALLVRFADPRDAVRFAQEVVERLGARHRALGVRIGIHTGTAVQRDGDWYGTAVNLAARISDLARAGDVMLSDATRAAAGLTTSDLWPQGRRHLKNIAKPVEVYSLPRETLDTKALPRDPVCHMAVDPDLAPRRTSYQGIEYFFCSETCADAFGADPHHYARRRSTTDALLVSDDARERVVRRLAQAYAGGRLTGDEMERRVEHAWQARTKGELRAITHDLPRRSRRLRVSRWRPRRWRRDRA